MSVRSYLCPGETQPISRPVHLARLAADYAKCSACPHCSDLGGINLPPRPPHVELPLAPLLQRERLWRSLRSANARQEVLQHCEALAALLWDQTPWELPLNDWDATETRIPLGPELCIAWQTSDIAESFATDVIRVMSRSGCRIVSLGPIHRPALDFAIDHLDGAAGLWIEGGGSPAGIGFRVIGSRSLAWSKGGRLDSIKLAHHRGARRPCRTAGAMKTFDIRPAYRESVIRHFDSKEQHVAVGGWTDSLDNAWSQLGPRAACQLHDASPGAKCEETPATSVVRSVQEEIVRKRLPGGAVFGADGRQVWALDRRDGLLSDRAVAERLAHELRTEAGEREIRVVASEELMWMELNVAGVRLVTCGDTEESLVETMHRTGATLGCDGSGRYWIARPAPRCDALLTLAYLIRTMQSRPGRP